MEALHTGQVATLLYRSPATIRRWANKGRFPNAWRTPGGHLRIPPYNLIPYLPEFKKPLKAVVVGNVTPPSWLTVIDKTFDTTKLEEQLFAGKLRANIVLTQSSFNGIVQRKVFWASFVTLGVWGDGWTWWTTERAKDNLNVGAQNPVHVLQCNGEWAGE